MAMTAVKATKTATKKKTDMPMDAKTATTKTSKTDMPMKAAKTATAKKTDMPMKAKTATTKHPWEDDGWFAALPEKHPWEDDGWFAALPEELFVVLAVRVTPRTWSCPFVVVD